jgi:hypothetical protein
MVVEVCKQEYVSNERRTPVHKPVYDRLMKSTNVDGALR